MDNVGKSGSNKMALVRFIEDNVEYACQLSRIRNKNCLRRGDIRNVKWIDDVFYPAKIEKIRSDAKVDVIFIQDNIKYRTQLPYISEANELKIGDRRLVKWTDGKYYESEILELGGLLCLQLLETTCKTISNNFELVISTNTNFQPQALIKKQSNSAHILKAKRFEEIEKSVDKWKQKLIEVQKSSDSTLPANLQCENSPSEDIVTKGQDLVDVKNSLKQGKKITIKRNWCKYCCQMQSKIGRHMSSKHKNVMEVKQYIEAPNPKLKKEIMQMIINQSNSDYNQKVIDKELEGRVIPVKKSTTEMSATSHAVCTSCGGLFSKVNISSHKITCEKRQHLILKDKPAKIPNFSLVHQTLDAKFDILRNRVLNNLNKDEISVTVIKDPLILEFGRRFLKGHMDDKQRNYVASKLRTMGDLVCRMKKADPININSLTDCLKVSNFDLLCEVVKQWSSYDDESGVCAVGSVPRRLCKSLKICSQVEWSEAIRNKDIPMEAYQVIRENHKKFMNLMSNDWALEVNCPGDRSLKTKKVENEDKMPLAEDIVKYFNEITIKLEVLTKKLKQQVSIDTYINLTKLTLAYLIAFNCRRPSEVAYATIDNYSKRNMSSDESNRLVVFTVSATKNDTKVPVIVPEKVQKAINALLNCRKTLNIVGQLLFSKPDGTSYNGSNIVMQAKNEISLKKPAHFTANGLRHYWATVSQMDQKMKAHMPKFLGHTLATHQRFYEMPMTTIHLDVIGPSMVQHYNISDENHSIKDSAPEEIVVRPGQKSKASDKILKCLTTPTKRRHDYLEESSGSEESLSSPLKMQKRNRWTTPEKLELLNKLPNTLLGIEPAGKGKIREVWENSKFIKKRHSLQMTRIEVSKYFTKKKKVPTPLKKQTHIVE